MSKRPVAALAVLLTAVIAAPAQAKPLCYTLDEVRATQVRQLHLELMVGALKCQTPDEDMRGPYASYVRKFGPTMNANAKVLQGLFGRHYGGDRSREFDRYITRVSNELSIQAQNTEDYCARQISLIEKVLDLKPGELESFAAQQVAKPEAAASCSGSIQQASTAAPAPVSTKVKAKPEAKPAKAKPDAAKPATPNKEG